MAIPIPKPALPDEYLVDNRVYTDERLFHQEMEHIFHRVWNFACHESEIGNPGDFLTTIVAGQPIIVCRNRDGKLRAFFNTCRHRAAEVEPERSGNTKVFTCLYHLWSYDLDGQLVGVPEQEAYETSYNPDGLACGEFGLVPVRVESLHRMVFICFDDAAPDLADFLGEMGDRLASPFGSPDVQMSVKWSKVLNANWKMQPENSRDGYHATLLHKRLRGVSKPRPYCLLGNGHAFQEIGQDYEAGMKAGSLDPILSENPELTRAFMAHPLPGMTLDHPSYIGTLFPDLLISVRYSTCLIEKQIPLSTGETLIEARSVHLKADTDEIRAIRDQHWDIYWVEGGGNVQEDWEAWEMQQKGVKSIGVRYSIVARGEPATEGLRGDDNRIRSFWREWRDYMGTGQNAPLDA